MNTKHTPGPWRYRPPSSTSFYIETPKGGILCSCNGLPDPKEWEANAALIAAAPHIKTALEDLLTAVNGSLVKAEPKVIAAMREARAAIEEAAK